MQVLSTFDNGRVEGFLDMRTLTPVEMTEPSMARRIAQRLKHFHTAPVQLKGADPGQAEVFPLIQKWYASWCTHCALQVWLHTDAELPFYHQDDPPARLSPKQLCLRHSHSQVLCTHE